MIVGDYQVKREREPGSGWARPHEYLDQEVTQAFVDGKARLYLAQNLSRDIQWVVIDGGKAT
jgi:hypothetical protein